MFTKKSSYEEEAKTNVSENKEPEKREPTEDKPKDVPMRSAVTAVGSSSVNKILKGSKLIGDINVTCDLELSGDVEGNITSLQKSNILIKGVGCYGCK